MAGIFYETTSLHLLSETGSHKLSQDQQFQQVQRRHVLRKFKKSFIATQISIGGYLEHGWNRSNNSSKTVQNYWSERSEANRSNYIRRKMYSSIVTMVPQMLPDGWKTRILMVFSHILYGTQSAQKTSLVYWFSIIMNRIFRSMGSIMQNKMESLCCHFHPTTPINFNRTVQTVFGPFKRYCNSASDAWMINNPGRNMSINDIPSIAARAFPLAAPPSNILSGFRVTGIWPYNENIFDESGFAPSFVSDRSIDETGDESNSVTTDPRIEECLSSIVQPTRKHWTYLGWFEPYNSRGTNPSFSKSRCK